MKCIQTTESDSVTERIRFHNYDLHICIDFISAPIDTNPSFRSVLDSHESLCIMIYYPFEVPNGKIFCLK